MFVTFYGVRGSIPTPGPATARYGGNTSCVHIRTRGGHDYIFDAGTGLRLLGPKLVELTSPITLLITHGHWDHIQGLPFFAPIFQHERDIRLAGPELTHASAMAQLNGLNFPVDRQGLPADVRAVMDPQSLACRDGIALTRMALNHPGGGWGYRLEEAGASVAYITDNELSPPGAAATPYAQWVELLRGVDVLIHDSQYVDKDMPAKHGWGHSLISEVRQLACDAGVGCLVIYHHDPVRDDPILDEIRIESEAFFRGQKAKTKVFVAFEGLALAIEARRQKRSVVKVLSSRIPG